MRTDLHLYSEAVGFVQHSPRQSAYVLGTDAAHSTAARQTTARRAVPAPTSQPDLGIKTPILKPVQPATHPVDRRDELQQAAQWCL
jgi:hypothetical protein